MKKAVAVLASLALSVGGMFILTGNWSAKAAAPAPPFTQCPAVGADTSCGILLVINPGGSFSVFSDPSQPAYENSEDTLVGVLNNSGAAVPSLDVTASVPAFGFDGDGICTVTPQPAGCPLGPTGYEGPNTSFSNVSPDGLKGTINFTQAGGLANGGSAYFGLEEALTSQSFTPKPQFSGYSTGTNVFADLLKNLQPGLELANVNAAFSGAASDTAGLKPLNNEMDHAIVPSDLETAGKAPIAPFNSYGRGSGLEVGLGTTIPNNPDVNQIILAGLAEQAAAPVTGTAGASQPDGSVVKDLPPGGIPGDPLIYASLLRGQAKALYDSTQCVVDPDNLANGRGEVGRAELINTAMGPLAPKLGDPNSLPLLSLTRGQPTQGTLGSSDSKVHLLPNGASTTNFGLMSETSQDIAPVTLFKGTANQLTIEVAGEWSLRALATGTASTSSLKYGPTFNGAPPTPTTPLITITPPGGAPQIVLKTQDIFGPGKVPQNIFIPGGPGPQLLELSIGEDPRAIGSDNVTTTPLPAPTVSDTEVSGAVDVVRVKLLAGLQTPLDHVGDVRVGHLEAKSVVPTGGVSCPGPVTPTTTTTPTTTPRNTTTTTQPGATTTTTQPGATTTTTQPGATTTTTMTTPGNTTTTTEPGGTTTTTKPATTTSTTTAKPAAPTTTTSAPAQVQAVTFSQTPTAEAQSQTPNFTG